MESFNETYEGQVALHHEVIKLLPAIVGHFSEYSGRAATQSGRSRYFNKIVHEFYTACKAVSNARVLVDDSYHSTIYLKIDIHLPSHHGAHVNYFSLDIHLGRIEDDMFVYGFDHDATEFRCNQVINTTQAEITEAKEKLIDFKRQISAVKESIPHAFSNLLDVRYH